MSEKANAVFTDFKGDRWRAMTRKIGKDGRARVYVPRFRATFKNVRRGKGCGRWLPMPK